MNLFELPSLPVTEELTTVFFESKNIRIERIVSTGQATGWYDQNESEFVALLQGKAEIEFDDGNFKELVAGDTLIISSHVRHRVKYTSSEPPCVWLCVFWE